MEDLRVHFENCYGIRSLKKDFAFKDGNHVKVIYASNGGMKTSFAKTFHKLQLGRGDEINDKIFPVPPGEVVKDVIVDGQPIDPDSIFVIKSFDDSYHSDNISALLLKEDVKKDYDELTRDLKNKERSFISVLASQFRFIPDKGRSDGLNAADLKAINAVVDENRIQREIVTVFGGDPDKPNEFYRVLDKLKERVGEIGAKDYSNIKYGVLFNEKILKDVLNASNKSLLRRYVERYKELIKSSKYFNLRFNHRSAETALGDLSKAHYFESDPSTDSTAINALDVFNKQDRRSDRLNKEELQQEVNNLKLELSRDPLFSELYSKLDMALDDTLRTKKFREYILEGVVDMEFLDLFSRERDPSYMVPRQELILSYLRSVRDTFSDFLSEYAVIRTKIEDVIKKVQADDSSRWHTAVREFNERFTVPFRIGIDELDKGRILIDPKHTPELKYGFCKICGTAVNTSCTHDDLTEKSEKELMQQAEKGDESPILSQGERRAFYLLNVLFEVKYRESANKETLFIVDDIADSFDYQNKYAIVEYLSEMSRRNNFYLVILTHNFDFFRTLNKRLYLEKWGLLDWCYLATRESPSGRISLSVYDEAWREPFNFWRDNIYQMTSAVYEKYTLAMLPFIREIYYFAKSPKFKKDYDIINKMMHGSSSHTLSEVCVIFENFFGKQVVFPAAIGSKTIDSAFDDICSSILSAPSQELADKVVLALGVRRRTETYLETRHNLSGPIHRTIPAYEALPGHDIDLLALMKRVNLVTPESIHVNSFMYEPIVDLDIAQLVKLYEDVQKRLV